MKLVHSFSVFLSSFSFLLLNAFRSSFVDHFCSISLNDKIFLFPKVNELFSTMIRIVRANCVIIVPFFVVLKFFETI